MSNRKQRARGRPSKTRQSSSVTRWRWCSTRVGRSPRSAGQSGSTRARWGTGSPGPAGNGRPGRVDSDERAELAELRGEIAQLRMERDLLKRSMAFWVKESERHEALVDRAVVKGHRLVLVAAGSLKLGAA